jgi:integrase
MRIRPTRLDTAERLPFLLNSQGIPMYFPLLWVLTERRAIGLATSTIEADLIAIKDLYCWSDLRGIPIENRFAERKILQPHEITSLFDYIKINKLQQTALSKKTINGPRYSSSKHSAIKIKRVIQYIGWLSDPITQKQPQNIHDGYENSRNNMLSRMNAKAPISKNRNSLFGRTSLSEEQVAGLLEFFQSQPPKVTQESNYTWKRDRLILKMLLLCGIRRGELAGIKINNIDPRFGKILIPRSPDDPDETRKHQPATKTNDREIPVSTTLMNEIQEYIFHYRRQKSLSKTHPYLFVSVRTGKPISLAGINNIFRSIRRLNLNISKTLSPHVLRHSFAVNYVQKMENDGVQFSRQAQALSEAMGWRQGSGTEAIYLKRHTKKQADMIHLSIQEEILDRSAQ